MSVYLIFVRLFECLCCYRQQCATYRFSISLPGVGSGECLSSVTKEDIFNQIMYFFSIQFVFINTQSSIAIEEEPT